MMTSAGSPRPTAFPSAKFWRISRIVIATATACAVDRFLSEERPELEPDEAQFHLDLYRRADPEDSFDQFEEQRETNVEFLRDLPAGTGQRVALHREAGEITLEQMMHEWAMHDLGHIPPDRGAGARPQTLGGRRAAGRILPAETLNNRNFELRRKRGELVRGGTHSKGPRD